MAKKSTKPYKKAYLEITNVCNLNCSFCPKTKRPPRFVSVEEFSHLLCQVEPFTDYVYLHLMGEPLLHPQLGELLSQCANHQLKVSLTTNGTLLAKQQVLLLSCPAMYRVSISLHSFEANCTGQTLEDYLADILCFCKAASEQTGIYCVLRLWNKDSALLKAQNQRNVDIFSQVRAFFGLDFDPAQALEQKQVFSIPLAEKIPVRHICLVRHPGQPLFPCRQEPSLPVPAPSYRRRLPLHPCPDLPAGPAPDVPTYPVTSGTAA